MQLYAIINTGGNEYRVSPGKKVKVDRLEAEPGETMEFAEISRLVNGDQVVEGSPTVKGARVRAQVVKHGQEKGVIVFKMKRRRLYQKKHDRQWQFTTLKIDEIVFEDSVFDKRDIDPKKLKKAAAADAKKARAERVPPPVPSQPPPEKPVPKAPPPVPPVVVAESIPAVQSKPATQRPRKWLALVALLALFVAGLLIWRETPVPATIAEIDTSMTQVKTDVSLLPTRRIDKPSDPAQPPD